MKTLLTVLSVMAIGCGRSPSLPFYGSADLTPHWTESSHRVGRFQFTSQSGDSLTNTDLAGRIYVASFIYTRCSVMCPTLVRQLQRVVDGVKDPRVVVLSFSVTPDLDTPEVLAAFGRTKHIDPSRWKLLTGNKRAIYNLARESFFATDERLKAVLDPNEALLHTERLTLVDGSGRIRGVYNGSQSADVDHLIADAGTLLIGK